MTDPFLQLVVEILNLTHPRFASAGGLVYTPEEADEPAAARKARERPFVMEFYSEFRRMWDRAEPVRRGLGHVMIRSDPDAGSRTPDLLFWKLGERGAADSRLAALSVAFVSNPGAVTADQTLLARFRDKPGYPRAVGVVVGRAAELAAVPNADGVTTILFDSDKWQVVKGDEP